MVRRSISFALAGALAAIPTGILIDVLANPTDGRWRFGHSIMFFLALAGAQWLLEDLGEAR